MGNQIYGLIQMKSNVLMWHSIAREIQRRTLMNLMTHMIIIINSYQTIFKMTDYLPRLNTVVSICHTLMSWLLWCCTNILMSAYYGRHYSVAVPMPFSFITSTFLQNINELTIKYNISVDIKNDTNVHRILYENHRMLVSHLVYNVSLCMLCTLK